MPLKIYNTLARKQEEFKPLESGRIKMYTCGPTVYDFAHIGNFRAYIFEDVLRRYLKYRGYEIDQVMNLTDVDDKTIRGSRAAGMSLGEYTEQYKKAFFEDLQTLNIEKAEHYPAATDHVVEMIDLIQRLLDKGCAYVSNDGSVYFSIAKFENYGRLARLDMSGLRPGARVEQDEYEKENVGDFALWKAWNEEDGAVRWDSPWGSGRPGWHIECSAMGMKYLGESFDIHTGGIDNMFPHHEDEIAQSEAATGKQFVRYWLHCAHLVVDGEKMSKSLGNFHTLRDVLDRGFSGREVRYVLMSVNYRQSLNFTFDALKAARSALERIDEFLKRLSDVSDGASPEQADWVDERVTEFETAMDDDLNVAEALAALFGMIHRGNKMLDSDGVSPGIAATALEACRKLDRVLGVMEHDEEKPDESIVNLVAEREAARKNRDWAKADELRDRLAEQGWSVKDTPQGSELRKTGA